jgi:phage repressor protein C with HTH and peptisase S24 domain
MSDLIFDDNNMLEEHLKMFHDSDEARERIRWAINHVSLKHGMTNERLAKVLGCATSTVNSYRRKITLPGLEFFALFIYKYGFRLEWFITGSGEPYPGASYEYPDISGKNVSPVVAEPEFPPDEFVLIRQVKGKISAGNGLDPDNTVDLRVAFRQDWIKRKGSPDNMSLIKVSGDSMEPTLMSGDLVLVDHGKTNIAPNGGIYAISIDHEIMIKRIQPIFSEGKFRIISDNRQYEPIDVETGQICINGKVIWYARDLER